MTPEIETELLGPFIEATRTTMGEMAGTDIRVQVTDKTVQPRAVFSVIVALTSSTIRTLILDFPETTAIALAKRILPESDAELEESLIQDCLCEIANVVAGQAKAMLANTAHQFSFSLPIMNSEVPRAAGSEQYLTIQFGSNQGAFTLQLVMSE